VRAGEIAVPSVYAIRRDAVMPVVRKVKFGNIKRTAIQRGLNIGHVIMQVFTVKNLEAGQPILNRIKHIRLHTYAVQSVQHVNRYAAHAVGQVVCDQVFVSDYVKAVLLGYIKKLRFLAETLDFPKSESGEEAGGI
jgi:hypothetical protein